MSTEPGSAKAERSGGQQSRPSADLPSLFTLAPHSDEDTSREAAKRIVPHKSRLQAVVLEAIEHYGPVTAEEIESLTELHGNTVRPRLVELRARGLVVDSGERKQTLSGRKAVAWRTV